MGNSHGGSRVMRRVIRAAASMVMMIGTAVGVSVATASPASATDYGPARSLHVGINENLCLDAALETFGNGGRVQLWTCTGSIQQRWFRYRTTLRSALDPSMCLDAAMETLHNGGRVQIWTCSGRSNQQWTWNTINELMPGVYGPGPLCLDAALETLGNGGRVQVWAESGVKQQMWYWY